MIARHHRIGQTWRRASLAAAVGLAILALSVYHRWQNGDAVYVPGVGSFYRFLAMDLSKAMLLESESFEHGPDGWVAYTRALLREPPPSPHAVLRALPDVLSAFRDENSEATRAAHRFLDLLGFPK